jgi:hypothetical protein
LVLKHYTGIAEVFKSFIKDGDSDAVQSMRNRFDDGILFSTPWAVVHVFDYALILLYVLQSHRRIVPDELEGRPAGLSKRCCNVDALSSQQPRYLLHKWKQYFAYWL